MVGLAYADVAWDARRMRWRLLAGPAIAAATVGTALAVACGGGSLPADEFPFDASNLALNSCSEEGSVAMPINVVECPQAACTGVAYAYCTGTVYGACGCNAMGAPTGIDTGIVEEAIMTGTDGGVPPVTDSGPVETGPAETGPVDSGKKPPKDTGPPDTGPVDTGAPPG
jgi:hypothetical protein